MCQVGQLYVNYAKRAKQSLLKSQPANIFPIYLLVIILGDLIAYRGGIINLKIEPI
jgi:hypothetical protein